MEGAIVIRRDGMAEAACIYLDVLAEGITLSKGLGSRHWAAAAISRKTKAIAVAVSQSSGTVRIFQDGKRDAAHRAAGPPHDLATFLWNGSPGYDRQCTTPLNRLAASICERGPNPIGDGTRPALADARG